MPDFAVFASGRGSNFQKLHQAFANDTAHKLCVLVTDKPMCGASLYAQEQNIPRVFLDYPQGINATAAEKNQTRMNVEKDLIGALSNYHPALLVFAGFMRMVSPVLINAYPGRVVNIHPSLLPRHPGAHGIEESYKSPDLYLGITIHRVDSGMDSGPIIVQERFRRKDAESLEHVEARIHELEYKTYPRVVRALLDAMQEEARA